MSTLPKARSEKLHLYDKILLSSKKLNQYNKNHSLGLYVGCPRPA